ncbi:MULTISPECIES: metal-sensitive transcriptional regulator [Parvularcula]|uniref:DNA-binding FrmR family transcriptional regulator n=1 Tax=Parvularcula dongshanensis TaxID=1173995 RepID=A0A840I7J1_9PROT|nr:metal-sensitive transcriptional regulator [Parvularcula oceani]MBB4660223.1 DNA-binding FrmR family transcriptional regulator [Parvularcula dongshanensis]
MAKETIDRLRRIEGQVRGIAGMIEDGRYCIDVLHQLSAVKAALRRVESEVLKNHAATCVEDAVRSGDPEAQREKVAELIDLFEKQRR